MDQISWEVERAARREAEATAARIARLQAATGALAAARTPGEVAQVALGAAISALGGQGGFVLVEGARGGLAVLRSHGAREEAVARAAADAQTPAGECFRGVAPVFVEDRASLLARYPRVETLQGDPFGEALAALPLELEGRPLGVLAVAFAEPHRFPEEDRAFAAALASQSAQALERARLFVAERLARAEAVAARTRLAFLDQVSALLAEASGEDDMLAGLVRLAVPALGEWAGIYVAKDSGDLALAASSGPASLGAAVDGHLRKDPRGRLSRTSLCGEPLVVKDFPPALAGSAPAAVLAPLCLKRKSIGAFVVASAEAAGRFGAADLALASDVAHRTALAVEHARLLREATLAAAAREEFLHVASHELRGPLGTLRLTVQLLGREAAKRDLQGIESRLRMLDRQAQKLVRLSDALLDVSRITAGRIELARDQGDLAAVVRDVAAGFEDEARDCGSELRVDAAGPAPCAFDAARIEQVVSNLLSNALKYGRGGPVRISAALDGTRARVEVEDRGIGIAPEDQERIFGRFERAVSGRQYSGLGLGLWIARRLVEAHGGRILVRSAPGEGSTFAVELPAS
ncbi:MAG TPA: ATP-binding protein [Anaeromyxobacter sp.]|nr:ATP-binding protein [Anaeromyxobacter sp.]